MTRLNAVAAHQRKDATVVASLALRLYLSRFNDLLAI